MRVRMKTDVSGSRDGQAWPKRGETFEVSDAEGADLCASGMAEPVADGDENVEKAVPGDSDKRALTTFDGPVGNAYLPKDGGHDPVVQGQKDAAMVAATPENRDVAARADDQHPPHEVTQDVPDEAAGDAGDAAQSAKKTAAPRKTAATKSAPAKPESK
jgi:hypothetical protein